MTIPFLDLFKKAKARLGKAATPAPVVIQRAPVIEKPATERLSKTVMPNTTRTVGPADPFEVAAGKGRRDNISLGISTVPEERAISLTLSDILDNLPHTVLKPRADMDLNRTISIKAAEVEKGMSSGEPMAMLSSIYEQAPEIFQQRVAPDDLTQISLPLDKVLQQFQAFHVRPDQTEDQAVPQVETPFLQVTIEDTRKFGTSLEPLQASAKPPVKVEPATARAFAKAEPEPVAQQKAAPPEKKTRHRVSMKSPAAGVPAPPAGAESSASPARIPFHLPPNGAGAPASERVPASSGPPVPTPPAHPPKTAAPARIPFKMTPPGSALKPKLTLVPGVEPAESEPPPPAPAETAKSADSTVKLRLNVCLRNVPAFQLSGSVPEIPDDVVIELPCSVIEPQLASGRVAIAPKLFQSAIPENFRENFVIDSTETPVLLPLQEVLQRIPTSVLQMRHDQEKEEAVNYFDTPFSKHADEDHKRFGKPAPDKKAETPKAETAKSEEPSAEKKATEVTEPEDKRPDEPVAGGIDAGSSVSSPDTTASVPAMTEAAAKSSGEPGSSTPATTAPESTTKTDEGEAQKSREPSAKPAAEQKTSDLEKKHNAKEFVLRASCLPGVAACSISFADGLTMADNFPPGVGAEGLCAVAPSLLQKIAKHMPETNLGAFNAMTLHCEKSPLTFFMKGNVCLSVLHADKELEPVTREQLADMTKELAQIFAQPETTHVDH